MRLLYTSVAILAWLASLSHGQMLISCALGKVCVKRHLCPNGVAITDGATIIVPRNGFYPDCANLEECCRVPTKTKPQDKCGYRNPFGAGIQMLNNGEKAALDFGEFPWLVAIFDESENFVENNIARPFCAGSLIAPDIVLTAGHCLGSRRLESLIVRAGDFDISMDIERLPYEEVGVSEVILHEQYYRGGLHNDIALLVLQRPLTWRENIRPICLPHAQTRINSRKCFVTGWGKDKYARNALYRTTPKKVEVPLVGHDDCQTRLRNTVLGPFFELDRSFVCAGGERGKDACEGDGGAPLMCADLAQSGHYYLVGMVSWGLECGVENIPAAYVNVLYMHEWILSKIVNRTDVNHFTLNP